MRGRIRRFSLKLRKRLAQLGAIGVAVVAILLVPLSNLILIGPKVGYAQDEFPTVVPSDAEFEQAFNGDLDQVIYIPGTLGPIEDWRLPSVTRPEFISDTFGYSEILGEPSRYLIWSTDENGNKRYYIVDESNEKLGSIRAEVDQSRADRRDMDANPPAIRIVAGVAGTVGFGIVSTLCTGGAVVSGFFQVWPLAAAFVGCDAVAVPLTVASASTAWNGITRVRNHTRDLNEQRRRVESDFKQLPFLDDS